MIRSYAGDPVLQPELASGDVVKIVRGRQSLRGSEALVLTSPDKMSYLSIELADGTKATVNHWDVEKV